MAALPAMKPKEEERLAFLLGSAITLDKIKPVTSGLYLVKGWLEKGALSCIYGAPNAGKSFLALDLMMHVITGTDWFGHRVAKSAGPGIYIVAEGVVGFKNRIEANRRNRPDLVKKAEAAGMVILPVNLDLHAGADAQCLIRTIEAMLNVPPAIIVIDTLAQSLGSGDENSGPDMKAFTDNMRFLQRETGAHVMVVHHTGKNEAKGMRGHSSLDAALDTEIEVSNDKTTGIRTVEAKKQRDLGFGAPFYFSIDAVEIGKDEDGDDVTSAVVFASEKPKNKAAASESDKARGAIDGNERRSKEAEERTDEALSLLPSGPPFTASDVADALYQAGIIKTIKVNNGKIHRLKRESARHLLKAMVVKGLLQDLGKGKFQRAILDRSVHDAAE